MVLKSGRESQSIRSCLQVSWYAGLKGLFGDRCPRHQLKRRKKPCALTVGNGAGGAMTSDLSLAWRIYLNTSVGASTVLGAAVCM